MTARGLVLTPCAASARMPPLAAAAEDRSPAPAVDFDRDVRPILAAHCFTCHGPGETTRRGGLRSRGLIDGPT